MRLALLALLGWSGCSDYEFDPSNVEGVGDEDPVVTDGPAGDLTANDDEAEVMAGTAIEINLVRNDEGDRPTIVDVTDPSDGGSVEILNRRNVLYESDPGFTGDETFEYTIEDDAGNSASASVVVSVSPRPTIEITSPADGAEEAGPSVTVAFSVSGCLVSRPSQEDEECHIHMYLDGSRYSDEAGGPGWYQPDPRELTGIPSGEHTIQFRLATNDGSDDEFDPLIADSVTVTLP